MTFIEAALSAYTARLFARRAVRNGEPVEAAARHGATSVWMLHGVGLVLIWSFFVLIGDVSSLMDPRSPSMLVLIIAMTITDVLLAGTFLAGAMTWVRTAPGSRYGWRRFVTRPVVLIGTMAALFPAKCAWLIAAHELAAS